MNLEHEWSQLQCLTVTQLRQRYLAAFGEPARSGNKPWLVKRLAWRLQALAEGDLSERARRRAAELARDADLRLAPPRPGLQDMAAAPTCPGETAQEVAPAAHDDRLPVPGCLLKRRYKGEIHQVKILAHGFEYQGLVFPSLSALAKKITGSHCNGFWFFRLGRYARGGQP